MTTFEEYAERYADKGVKEGDRVTYHGSLSHYHGREYVVARVGEGWHGQPGALTLTAVDGHSPGELLVNARQSSVTVLPRDLPDDADIYVVNNEHPTWKAVQNDCMFRGPGWAPNVWHHVRLNAVFIHTGN